MRRLFVAGGGGGGGDVRWHNNILGTGLSLPSAFTSLTSSYF